MSDSALQEFLVSPILYVEVDGHPIAYRRFGKGPAILLVHGWPLSGVTYRAMVQELSKTMTCYVPDLPGAGSTAWDPRINDIFVDFARMLRGFVDVLDVQRFALVGHDSGGAIARLLSADLGDRVSALILTNTEVPGHMSRLVWLFQKLAALPGASLVFRALMAWRSYRRSALGFGGAFGDVKKSLDGDFHEACVVPLMRSMEGAVLTLRHADFGALDSLRAAHARITAPTLMVWGASDGFFPLEHARPMAGQFVPHAELQAIPRTRLFVHEEEPELVMSHVAPFLARAVSDPSNEIHESSSDTRRLTA